MSAANADSSANPNHCGAVAQAGESRSESVIPSSKTTDALREKLAEVERQGDAFQDNLN